MHAHSVSAWEHDHNFLSDRHARNELRVRLVVILSLAMMAAEVAAGVAFGSMALLADGLHMATHAGALAIAAAAYSYARRHQHHPAFAFGTGKLGDLAAFGSAIVLAVAALLIGWESVGRFAAPVTVDFEEAIGVAVIGLMVNLAGAWLLHDPHVDEGHGHHDHNHRAAYLHVVADALTSVLAIGGLIAAKAFGWRWIDPAVGLLGAVIIGRWAAQLMKQAAAVLLDVVHDPDLPPAIRSTLETDGDQVTDLHVWRVGPGHTAAVVAIVTRNPRSPDWYRARLSQLRSLCHVTVEVHSPN